MLGLFHENIIILFYMHVMNYLWMPTVRTEEWNDTNKSHLILA